MLAVIKIPGRLDSINLILSTWHEGFQDF